MSKRAEQAAGKNHNRALLEAEKYATSHGRSIVEEVAFGRGFKAGFIKGYEQAEKDMIHIVKTWLSETHRVCDITDENGYRIELRNLIASLEKTLEEEQ